MKPKVDVKKPMGGCSCGAVRYEMTAPPLFVHACHCRDCQRHTGSAFVVNAMVLAAEMTLTKGAVEPWPIPAKGGAEHFVHRCPDCKVGLFSTYGGRNTVMRYLRVGTLDAPETLPPEAHIFTRSKQPWIALPENVPAFKTWYDRDKMWPPESLARRTAASKGRKS
jgi:hypothetical protein